MTSVNDYHYARDLADRYEHPRHITVVVDYARWTAVWIGRLGDYQVKVETHVYVTEQHAADICWLIDERLKEAFTKIDKVSEILLASSRPQL